MAELSVPPTEREQLVAITRSRSMPHALVTRAHVVLLAAEGCSNTAIATQLGLSEPTVGLWRQRYLAAKTRLSKSTVHRVWKAFGLQRHRQKHF